MLEDEFDYKQDPKVFAEDDVQDALRKALFNKMKQQSDILIF